MRKSKHKFAEFFILFYTFGMEYIRFMPVITTSAIFGGKNAVTYNPSDIWNIFDKKSRGVPLNRTESNKLTDFYISIAIIVIKKIYPYDPIIHNDEARIIRGEDQLDEVFEIIARLIEYYEKDLQKRVMDHFPTCPTTVSENRIFHSHFTKKARNIWVDIYRKAKKEALGRMINDLNDRLPMSGPSGLEEREDDYSQDMLLCSTPLNFQFASPDLFDAFTKRCSPIIEKRVLADCVEAQLSKGLAGKIADILALLLCNNGYKIIERGNPENAYVLVVNGKLTPLDPELRTAKVSDSSSANIGITIALKHQFTDGYLSNLKKDGKSKRISKALVVSNLGGEERKALQHKIGTDGLETWELLDLAGFIQREYSNLSTEEQAKVNTLINELIADF